MAHFDEVATQKGLDLPRLHYVANADLEGEGTGWGAMALRFHRRARKPFFTPPEEVRRHGHGVAVVGDQYLTDRLLAWRLGFAFGLVSAIER